MGYYATIQSSSNGQYVGATTPCLLVPSMSAGYWLGQYRFTSMNLQITSWDEANSTFALYAQQAWVTGAPFATHTVRYAQCTTQPASYSLPTFTGGVSDPAILPTGIASATGVSTALHIDNPTVTLEIPQQTDAQKVESFQDGLTLGWGVAAVMVVVYLIRRIHR